MYIMTICSGTYWEQPWIGFRGQHNQTCLRTEYTVFKGTWRWNIVGKTTLTNMYFAHCLFKEAAGKKYFFSEMIDKVIHNLNCEKDALYC